MAAAKKMQSERSCEERESKQKHGNANQRKRNTKNSALSRRCSHIIDSDELMIDNANTSESNGSASSLYSITSDGGRVSAMAGEPESVDDSNEGSIHIQDIEEQNKLEDSSVDTREDDFLLSTKKADAIKRRQRRNKRVTEIKENRQLRRGSIGKRRESKQSKDLSAKSKSEENERGKIGSLSSSKVADNNSCNGDTDAATKSSKTKKKKKRGSSLKRHERPLQAAVDESVDLAGSGWWNLSYANVEDQKKNSTTSGAVVRKPKRRKDRSKTSMVASSKSVPFLNYKHDESVKKTVYKSTMLEELIESGAAERRASLVEEEFDVASAVSAPDFIPSAVKKANEELKKSGRAGTLNEMISFAAAEQQDRVAQAEANAFSFKAAVDTLPSPENNDEDIAALERQDSVLRAEANAISFKAAVDMLSSPEDNDEDIAAVERQDSVLRAEANAITFKAAVDTLSSPEINDEDIAAVERQDRVLRAEANAISFKAAVDTLPSPENNDEDIATVEREDSVLRAEANAISLKETVDTLPFPEDNDQEDQDIKVTTGHASTLNEMIAAAAAERQNRVARGEANAISFKATVDTLPFQEDNDQDDQDIKVTGHASTLNEMIAAAAAERRNRVARGEVNDISFKAKVNTSSSESSNGKQEEYNNIVEEYDEIATDTAVSEIKIWKRPVPVEEEKTKEQEEREKRLKEWKERTWTVKYDPQQRKRDMQNHRKFFMPVAGEAATYGRLVRLEEKVVESQGGQYLGHGSLGNGGDNTWSGPKMHDDRRSSALRAIHEAAAMGRMKRLKPETVTSHNEVDEGDNVNEDYFDIENQVDEHGEKILRTNFLLDQHVKKMAKGKKDRMFSDSDLIDNRDHKISSYADFDDVELPTETLPTFDRIRGKQLKSKRKRNFTSGADLAVIAMNLSDKNLAFETDDDPDDPDKMTPGRFRVLEAISRNVAASAWERAYRLQRPRAVLKLTNKCNCPYCGDPTPFQTHKYKRLMYPERFPDVPDHEMQCQQVVESPVVLPDTAYTNKNNDYFISPGGRKKKKIRIVRRKKKRPNVVDSPSALTTAISPNSKQRVVEGTFLTPDELDSLTEQLQRQGAGAMTTNELVQIAMALKGRSPKVFKKTPIGNEEESSNLNDQVCLSTQSQKGTNTDLSTENLLQTAAELSTSFETTEDVPRHDSKEIVSSEHHEQQKNIDVTADQLLQVAKDLTAKNSLPSDLITATNDIQQDDRQENLNVSVNLSFHEKEIDNSPTILSTDDTPERAPCQIRPPKSPSAQKAKLKLRAAADFRNNFNSPVPRKPKMKVNAETIQGKNSKPHEAPQKTKMKLKTKSKSMSQVSQKTKLKINAETMHGNNNKSSTPQKAKMKVKTKSKSMPKVKLSAEAKSSDNSKSPAPQKAKLKLRTKTKSKSISPVPQKTKMKFNTEAKRRSNTKSPVPRKAKMRFIPGPPLSLSELSNSSDHLSSSSHNKAKNSRRHLKLATPDSSQKSSLTLPSTSDERTIENKKDLSKKTLRARLKSFKRSSSARSQSPRPFHESKSTSNLSSLDCVVEKPKTVRRGGRRSHSVESRPLSVVKTTRKPVQSLKVPKRANSLKNDNHAVQRSDPRACHGKESMTRRGNVTKPHFSTSISQPEKQSQMIRAMKTREGARNWELSRRAPTRTRSLPIGKKQKTPEDCNQGKKNLASEERKSDTRISFSENQRSRVAPTRSRSFQDYVRNTNIHAITSSLNRPSSTMDTEQLKLANDHSGKLSDAQIRCVSSRLQQQQLVSNSMNYPAPPSFRLKSPSKPETFLSDTPTLSSRNPEKVMRRGRSLDRINIKRLTGHGLSIKKEKSEENGRVRKRRNSMTGGWFSKKGE